MCYKQWCVGANSASLFSALRVTSCWYLGISRDGTISTMGTGKSYKAHFFFPVSQVLSIYQHTTRSKPDVFFFFFFLLASPMAYGNSQVRNRIWAETVILNPLDHSGNSEARFLTCCSVVSRIKTLQQKARRKEVEILQVHVKALLKLVLFIYFLSFVFLGPYSWLIEVPRLGVELQLCLHHSSARFPVMSATYTAAHGNAVSLTHWARPGSNLSPLIDTSRVWSSLSHDRHPGFNFFK